MEYRLGNRLGLGFSKFLQNSLDISRTMNEIDDLDLVFSLPIDDDMAARPDVMETCCFGQPLDQ